MAGSSKHGKALRASVGSNFVVARRLNNEKHTLRFIIMFGTLMHYISKYHFIVKTQLPSTAKYCELKQLDLAPKNLSQTGECLKKNHLSEY